MLVIGNGESRKNINISKLDGPKVGCNAIFRDYFTDHIVCVDKRMVEEAILSQANIKGSFIYTRPDWFQQYKTIRVRSLPNLPYEGTERWDEPFNWGSGPYAVLLGAMLSKKQTVNLVGYDLFSKTRFVNNIYKNTQNYDSEDKRAVDPRYWIHQIFKIFEYYNKKEFIIYNSKDWELPQAWNLPNVKVDNINSLV